MVRHMTVILIYGIIKAHGSKTQLVCFPITYSRESLSICLGMWCLLSLPHSCQVFVDNLLLPPLKPLFCHIPIRNGELCMKILVYSWQSPFPPIHYLPVYVVHSHLRWHPRTWENGSSRCSLVWKSLWEQ